MLGITMTTIMQGVTKPAVSASATSSATGTTHTVTMPTHSNGQFLLTFFEIPSNPTLSIDASSVGTWTQVHTILLGTSVRWAVYKCAATDSNMQLVITSSSSGTHRAVTYAFDNADTANYGTYVQVSALGTPNPPSLTLTDSPRNAIFLCAFGGNSTTYNPSAVSTNYVSTVRTSGTGGTVITAHREIADATTEDPGAWTGNIGSSTGLVNTYAVYKV